MSGKARDKVVTSGRLAGKATTSRAPPDPGPPPRPQPAFSLYSADSEDQVGSLHRGLDQCAALLTGILQADNAASPGLQKSPKKAGSSTLQGRKTAKKFPTKAASPGLLRTARSGAARSRGPVAQGKTITRRTAVKTGDLQGSERHQPSFTPPPAHAGVRLHPPQRPTPPSARRGTPQRSVPPPQNRSLSAPRGCCRAACDTEEDPVPVRDGGGGVSRCSLKESSGPEEENRCRGGTRAETLRRLLDELRALSAGQGAGTKVLLGLVS